MDFVIYRWDFCEANYSNAEYPIWLCLLCFKQTLPSSLNSKDLTLLTVFFEGKIKSNIESVVMAETYLVGKNFMKTLNAKFQAKMEEKANDDLKKPNYVLAIKTENVFIGGSGAQPSSSTSSKSSKSKSKKGATSEQSDSSAIEITFIDKTSLVKELKFQIKDLNDDLLDSLVEHFLKYKLFYLGNIMFFTSSNSA